MKTDQQTALFDLPASGNLTARQRFALAIVNRAGVDGIHTDELGAYLCHRNGKHSPDDRCQRCARNGRDVLEALKKRELVRYRRGRDGVAGYWQPIQPSGAMLRDDEPLPF